MPQTWDAIVIGGGHNGLVTAAYLARAGKKVLVLERRYRVGGAAVSEEIYPGFTFSVFSYVVSLLRPEIIRDLDLPRHGLEILPLESTVTPMENGDYLAAWGDPDKTRREICRHSLRDAEAMVEFGRLMHHMARAVKPILGMVPPDPTSLSPKDLLGLLRLGKHFRDLGPEKFHALYKLMTMSAADYLDEWYETDAAQGHEVGERHHRHLPRPALALGPRTCCCTTTWGRSTARSARGGSPRAAPARSARRSPGRRAALARRSGPTPR